MKMKKRRNPKEIFFFPPGGFIYIATVSVIPELLERSTLRQSILEIFWLLVGIGMMVVISWYE